MKNKSQRISLEFTKHNILRGAIIYSAGDTIAALVLGEFSLYRLLGMIVLGATVYAFEIPNYFKWIDQKTEKLKGLPLSLAKTALAVAYFNPLWIWRHLAFIKIVSGQWQAIDSSLLMIASLSFLVNIPISFIANYLIQNSVKLKWRFLASAIFSALMAIYYALSETIFKY